MNVQGVWEIWGAYPSWRDFYNRFRHDIPAARGNAFELGKKTGGMLMTKLSLKGDDLDTLAKVVNAFMEEFKTEPTAKVEGDKVIYRNRSFCLMMVSAKSLNIPWLWLDENVAWPVLAGLASSVNPRAGHRVLKARVRGDSICEHIFELE